MSPQLRPRNRPLPASERLSASTRRAEGIALALAPATSLQLSSPVSAVIGIALHVRNARHGARADGKQPDELVESLELAHKPDRVRLRGLDAQPRLARACRHQLDGVALRVESLATS